ncbi:MAG: HalOD1 output domain-containing protein [Halanaeroarchaeum sp.]
MDGPSPNGIEGDTDVDRDGRKFEFSRTLTPSVAVVEAVSDVTDTDPTSHPPLHEFVDTDGLNALLTNSNADPETLRVSFDYLGHTVTVVGDGTVHVRPVENRNR